MNTAINACLNNSWMFLTLMQCSVLICSSISISTELLHNNNSFNWSFHKFKLYVVGIGYGMVVFIAIVAIYYNVIISWCLYYFGNSFFPTLPWSSCSNEWNTDSCYERFGNTTNSTSTRNTGTVYEGFRNVANETSFRNVTNTLGLNITAVDNGAMLNTSGILSKTSSEEFWEYVILIPFNTNKSFVKICYTANL